MSEETQTVTDVISNEDKELLEKKFINPHTVDRQPDDRCVVSECRAILIENGLAIKVKEAYDTDSDICMAKSSSPEAQRDILNRYWMHQLLSSPIPSVEQRFALISDGTIDDWLRLFRQIAIPFILENDLPKVI